MKTETPFQIVLKELIDIIQMYTSSMIPLPVIPIVAMLKCCLL